jgi:hypothetical protein
MQVCPFIVGEKEHADLEKVKQANPDRIVLVDDSYVSAKRDTWVIKKADGWGYVTTQGGTVLIQPHVLKETGQLKPKEMTASDWDKVAKELSK